MEASENVKIAIGIHEGLRLKAYRDTGGIWTIGYGHTGKDVHEGLEITLEKAEDLFKKDIQSAVDDVNSLGIEFNQNQFDALVSLVFNCGLPRFKYLSGKKQYGETVLWRKIQTNPYNPEIKYVWLAFAIRDAKGNVLAGLQNRRKREAELYFK